MNSTDRHPDPPGPHRTGTGGESPAHVSTGHAIILRHLAKLRDGALSLLELIGSPLTGRDKEEQVEASPEKSPLEVRIERHMRRLDAVLTQIRDLNPEKRPRAELAPDVLEQIETKQRTIHDIVGAELHYWSAAVENAPLDRFDPIERDWISRILRLADRMGVDEEHQEHLKFLRGWEAQNHSGTLRSGASGS